MEEFSILIAYVSLGLMAILPIYLGSFDSLPHPKKMKQEKEVLSKNDAYWFPIIGSVVLFSFYLLFTFLSKEMINFVLTCYFAIFGALALFRLFKPIMNTFTRILIGEPIENEQKSSTTDTASSSSSKLSFLLSPLTFSFEHSGKVVLDGSVNAVDGFTFVLSCLFTVYYVISKNWIASNLFGEAFSVGAISLLHLDSFITGSVLLSGLFIYDIFWVFGTNVMVTVAKSFDAPVKLLFPRDIFADKYEFALLGLGDIVIPGIFVALCLRFDHERAGRPESHRFPKPYFIACFISYIIGLATTVLVMHTFKAAQPALLYLSPACILSVLVVALFRREFGVVWNFTTITEEDGKDGKATTTNGATKESIAAAKKSN